MKKDIVIKRFTPHSVDLIRDEKNITIYLWKFAVKTWDETQDVIEFSNVIEKNNITLIYFEDRENYLNKQQWVIADKNGDYWTGHYGSHPFGGRARVFLRKSYARKYNSKVIAKRSAEKMKKNGVFAPSGVYILEKA